MKPLRPLRRPLAALTALAAAFALALPARAEDVHPADLPAVSCEAYIILDADSGQVLLEQNADERLYPASITKIMTLGLALQKADGDWSGQLTVPDEAVYSLVGTDSSHIALQPGEVVNLEDILYATQLASANDGANLLACYIGGSIQGGVEAMNRQAQALGLQNTHFTNPHGLMDTDHYTSARDMAAITRWALEQPGFETLFCRTDTWTMGPTNLQPETRYFGTDDWMRVGQEKYREYALGSKSGYHIDAGQTFVTLCQQDGIRLIGVLMKDVSKETKFADACALMDYCFENFERAEAPSGDASALSVPVKGGGDELGSVSVAAGWPTVLLHRQNLEAALSTRFELPQCWVLGTEPGGSRVVTVEGGAWQSDAEARYPVEYTGLESVLESARGVRLEASQTPLSPWGIAAGAAAGLAALAGLWKLAKTWRRRARPMGPEPGLTFIRREWLPGPTIRLKESGEARGLDSRPLNPRR